MTEEERASVREKNRLRTIQMRNMEPPERRAVRLEHARLRARQSRSAATDLVRSQWNELERVGIAEIRTQRTLQPVPPGPSSIENDGHGIEKLVLKTQVS